MDQRDEILRQMAALAKLQVTERSNGQVVVTIEASSSGGEIVNCYEDYPDPYVIVVLSQL